MKTLSCILMGYLIGSINPSYFLARRKGFDIREKGSHNAGASNAVILLGKGRGIFCALFDILKTCFVIAAAKRIFPFYPHTLAVTGTSCIIGHIYPFYMKFRGGKGLACLGGMILMYDRRVFLVFLSIEAVILLITNYICFVPITAAAVFPFTYGVLDHDRFGTAFLLAAAAVILFKHIENLRRIKNGTELRFSYLWNKEAEMQRLGRKSPEEE